MLPEVEILDLAGPLQAFDEARRLGAAWEIVLAGEQRELRSGQGVTLAGLETLPEPRADDLVLVPGMRLAALGEPSPALLRWLRAAWNAGAEVGSVCVGAFVLGAAGLLDGRDCTTHWSRLDELARRHSRARVLADRLFVEDGQLVTSAGIASGIDLALALLERREGPRLAARVAQEMVVYLRRDGRHGQRSVFVDFRSHLHPGIHRVQDWIAAHADRRATVEELAAVAHLSPRHLTRRFKEKTGVTLHDYVTRVRLERARTLLHDPRLTVEAVAERCGFESSRQLRRLWSRAHGRPPSAERPRRATP